MKKFFLVILGLFYFALPQSWGAEEILYYTCPMHPQIKMEQMGSCPICGMDLVPIKKSASRHQTQSEGITIDPSRTQQIGLQIETVQRRPLHKTFLLQGRVAHDPKLWVAQKEYIIALKLGDTQLIQSAEDKLYFMGLSKSWIRLLKKTRKANLGFHLPTPGEPTFFEAFLYQGDVQALKPGTQVEIYDLKSRKLAEGNIKALGTMVDLESQTIRALIQSEAILNLKSNTLVQFKVSLDLGNRLAIPKSAILFDGDRNRVYVQTEKGQFISQNIQLGEEAGDYYEITEGLNLGDQVVINGHFLMDSETQIKLGTPEQHKH